MARSTNPKPDAPAKVRQREERFQTNLPLSLNDKQGKIHNISASGVYFEIDADSELGSKVNFVIDLETPGGPIQVKCHGEIVRTQKRAGKLGVAVKIISSDLIGAH